MLMVPVRARQPLSRFRRTGRTFTVDDTTPRACPHPPRSSSCKRARLAAVTYEEGTLRTAVVDGKTGSHPDRKLLGGSCSDDYSVDAYRLVVSPGEAPVRRVRAVERDVEGREASATRAVSGTEGSS
jgi:hypothetical protein